MTNPAWTPLVSAACAKPDKRNSATSAGMTADAENHSAIAATWQTAMTATEARFDCESRVTAWKSERNLPASAPRLRPAR